MSKLEGGGRSLPLVASWQFLGEDFRFEGLDKKIEGRGGLFWMLD